MLDAILEDIRVGAMADLHNSRLAANIPHKWQEDDVFLAMSDRTRRKLLVSLGKNGAQTATQLQPIEHLRGGTLKHLEVLQKLGFIQKRDNPADGRRPLYELVPTLPVSFQDSVCLIEFGSLLFRLDAK